jgi:hypothetical protein
MAAKSTSSARQQTGGESPKPGVPQQQTQDQSGTDIRFDPRRLVSAMVFHACDGGSVEEVSPSSVRLTMRRLVRERICAVMSRTRWAELSNPQRMQWLLKVSRTEFEAVAEGYGVLKERAVIAKR